MSLRLRIGLALLAGTVLASHEGLPFGSPGSAQDPADRGSKTLLAATERLGGIDTGVDPRQPVPVGPAHDPLLRASRVNRDVSYVAGQVIVKFRDGGGVELEALAADGVQALALETPRFANFNILRIPVEDDPEEVAARLRERGDVEYAQAAYVHEPMFRPNDPQYQQQWNLSVLDMERAWDINPGASSDVIVAVLDTGVAYRDGLYRFTGSSFAIGTNVFPPLGPVSVPFALAPDLGPATRFVAPHDFIWDDEEPLDMAGHGTHVAGTIGQATNNGVGVAGVAFNVRIMPVKVIRGTWDSAFRAPFSGTDAIVAQGIRYAADNGAKVMNMSFGRTAPPEAPVVEDAMRYAVSRGAFLAISAGNAFESGNPRNVPAEIAARIDGAMSVASVSRDRTRAYYSSTGGWVEIAAPGGDTRLHGTTGGVLQQTFDAAFSETFTLGPARYTAPRFDMFAFRYFQGTSMAAPHVAGFAALLYKQGITDPAAIEAAIIRFATDLGSAGRDEEFGYGLINPRATLRGLGLAR